jgi:hypothetical protein
MEETLNEAGAPGFRAQASMEKFVQHLSAAKQALSEMYQASGDSQSGEQVQSLLNGVTRLMQAAKNMQAQQPASGGSGTYRKS